MESLAELFDVVTRTDSVQNLVIVFMAYKLHDLWCRVDSINKKGLKDSTIDK